MIDAKELARSGCKYLGTPYSTMDCQKLWEKMLSDCGLKMDLGGSNSWYRYMMKHGWVGTPEECAKTFGDIPQGATLFIHEAVSESTPAQFRDDGIGDITHMGDYTAMTGKEMVDIALEEGVSHADKYNYGNGAIHSSSSRDGVCTSKFAGKTIPNGGWNRVGLFLEKVEYHGIEPEPEPGPGPEPEPMIATVYSENGKPVKMRAKPSTSCKLYDEVFCGVTVEVLQKDCSTDSKGEKWSQISYGSREGWYMMSKFLLFAGGSCIVIIPNLSQEQAEELVKQYPGAYIEIAKG